MGDLAAGGRPALLDLVELDRWQRLQDHFTSVLGLPIRTVAPNRTLLVTPSWPTALTPDRAVEMLHVGEELELLLPDRDIPQDITSLTTSQGVTYAAVPIRVTADQIVAYFIIGPMIVGLREEETDFRQRVGASVKDLQALWSLILSLRVYTFSGIRSVLKLMEEVGASMGQFAYQARQLGSVLPSTNKADLAVVTYYTERVLHSLLEAAALATKAEGGSVMLYDQQAGAFTIKASQGLSDDVVAQTRVKPGEGLAGLAAQERQILLVDPQTTDPRVKARMQRENVTSALVAPLVPDGSREAVGIVNLRTANAERPFTGEHVELLRRLIDLAAAALCNLRSTSSNTTPRPLE